MKIFKVGDTQKAVCETCKSIENATFSLRDVPFSDDGHGVVKSVLVGVCDKCDHVVLIPQQSAPAIKKQLDARRKPVESRVPAHMVDILNLASISLGASVDFSSALIKYYIHTLSQEGKSAEGLLKYLESDLAKGQAQKRISLKGRFVSDELNAIKLRTHLESTTDVLKAVVLKINDDVLVNPNAKMLNKLKSVAAAFV
jgi:hypothetical protein